MVEDKQNKRCVETNRDSGGYCLNVPDTCPVKYVGDGENCTYFKKRKGVIDELGIAVLFTSITILLIILPNIDKTLDTKAIDAIKMFEVNSIKLKYSMYGCGRTDFYSKEFTGIRNGEEITGSVCGNYLKRMTVRF